MLENVVKMNERKKTRGKNKKKRKRIQRRCYENIFETLISVSNNFVAEIREWERLSEDFPFYSHFLLGRDISRYVG